MQRLALVVMVFTAVGCKGDSRPKRELVPGTNRLVEKPAPSTDARISDPACAAKLKDFEAWATALEMERSSYEIEMGNHLATIDAAPAPVEQRGDSFDITPQKIQGFDASESNHADYKLGKDPKDAEIAERLTAMHGMPNDDPDRLRIDVDEATPWKDVVRVVTAAEKVGYKEALFAFAATSKLTPPPGVEPWTTTTEAHDAAEAKLKELKKQCKAWDEGIIMTTKELVEALDNCSCAVDLDEVRAAMFKETRWHQAHPRVGVLVHLGDGGKTVTASPKATWLATHKQLLDAAAGGAPVKLVAK